MIDVESLRNKKLIEEREMYENDFISIEDIMKSDELDYYWGLQYEEYLIGEFESELDFYNDNLNGFIYPFEDEDFLIQLRDEKLIKERESYEKDYFKFVDFPDKDIFDFQISAREGEFIDVNEYDYDFEYAPEVYSDFEDYEYYQYEEDMYWKLFYLKKSQFTTPECRCTDLDYMPHDDGLCDYMDCYDYPEGPNENLCGMKYY